MSNVDLKITHRDGVAEGLKDGGHVIVPCSNCDARLLDIWITRPDENSKRKWKVRGNCPFCGDKSFVTEIQGGFHVGGYGKPKEDDEDDVIPSTEVDDFDIDGEVIVYKVRKANENAKPYRT